MKPIHISSSITVYQSALFQTNATIIVGAAYVLVVDPNWLPDEVDFLFEAAETAAGKNKKRYLLFTHSDYDHIIGYGRFTGYTTIASKNFVDNPAAEKSLEQIRVFDDEYYIKRSYPTVYPKIDHIIDGEGQALLIGEDTYVFYQARGHNLDGLITCNQTRKLLIAGDYLCAVEFPYLYDSLAEYRKTLNTFESLLKTESPKVLVPGHGSIATKKKEMLERLRIARAYLDALEQSVRSKTSFDFEALLANYDFPKIMLRFHEGNVALVRKEMGG